MIFCREGIVFVGVRNNRPTINWPGVAVGTLVAAFLVAAGSCCFSYLLFGSMILPWPQLLVGVVFYTELAVGFIIVRGKRMPIDKLPLLDQRDAP
jgi:hypothetical protein